MVANAAQVQASNAWLIDTGCSNHVTPNLSQPRKHGCSTRGAAPASNAIARASVCVCIFFFFFSDSHQLDSIRADTARFVPNRADSVKIGLYRLYRVVSASSRKRPKQAGNGRNRPWIWLEKPKLAFFFLFFCESRHSNVFFKNILIVKIYRKYK